MRNWHAACLSVEIISVFLMLLRAATVHTHLFHPDLVLF